MILLCLPRVLPLAETAVGGNALDLRTVLLVLALAGVAYLARQLMLLRAEIDSLRRPLPAPAPTAGAARPANATPTPHGPPTPGEVLAIIAAIHEVLGHNARLVAVAPVPTSQVVWSMEGRREVFRSHQVR